MTRSMSVGIPWRYDIDGSRSARRVLAHVAPGFEMERVPGADGSSAQMSLLSPDGVDSCPKRFTSGIHGDAPDANLRQYLDSFSRCLLVFTVRISTTGTRNVREQTRRFNRVVAVNNVAMVNSPAEDLN